MAGKPSIKPGDKFGRLTVIRLSAEARGSRVGWLCRCNCGAEAVMEAYRVKERGPRPCKCDRKKEAQAKRDAKARSIRAKRNAEKEARETKLYGKPEGTFAQTRAEAVQPQRLAKYRRLPEKIRAAVDEIVQRHVAVMLKYNISIASYDRLYQEAMEIALMDAENPPPPVERYEPFRAYTVYQSPKGA